VDGDGCPFLCQVQICGNGVTEPGEVCDDGNAIDGNGGSSSCVSEGCPLTGTWRSDSTLPGLFLWSLVEAPGGTVTGVVYPVDSPENAVNITGTRDGGAVTLHFQSPSVTFFGSMSDCDTVNLTDVSGPMVRQPAPPCGDGVVDPGQECDDGNAVDGDCCSAACQLIGPDGDLDTGRRCLRQLFHHRQPRSGECRLPGTPGGARPGLPGRWRPLRPVSGARQQHL